MYQPTHFREERLEVQHDLIRAHPLGMLVTLASSGILANPIPFVLDAEASPLGTLRAHLARANSQWHDYDPNHEALVIFQGVETYITPSLYASKQEGGKVVPTWNYVVVQAYGTMRAIDNPEWLKMQVSAMTDLKEATLLRPWSIADAPSSFIQAQLKGIVGIEIAISRIEGKWKVTQNRPEADRRSVADGLKAVADESSRLMAELVEARGAAR